MLSFSQVIPKLQFEYHSFYLPCKISSYIFESHRCRERQREREREVWVPSADSLSWLHGSEQDQVEARSWDSGTWVPRPEHLNHPQLLSQVLLQGADLKVEQLELQPALIWDLCCRWLSYTLTKCWPQVGFLQPLPFKKS